MARGRKKGTKVEGGKVVELLENKVPESIKVAIGKELNIDSEASEGLSSITEEDIKQVQVNEERSDITWDFPIGSEIEYFQADKTYELTKYRPVNETQGLDFRPEWFTEARDVKVATGHYTKYRPGTKAHRDFWTEQFRRCIEGYESHGYRVTGDNYFFLNFYRLKNVTSVEVAGRGRSVEFPRFFSKQYEYFHYIDLCEHLKKDICALKARGVG